VSDASTAIPPVRPGSPPPVIATVDPPDSAPPVRDSPNERSAQIADVGEAAGGEPVVISEPSIAPIAMTSPTAEAVTWPIRVASEWAARLLVIAAGLYVLGVMLDTINLVAFAFVLALFFTSVLHPVEQRLRPVFGGRKSASSAVVLLGGIIVFGLVGWFVVQQISSHSGQLSDQVGQVGDKLQSWLQTGPLKLKNADLNQVTASLTKTIKSHQGQFLSSALQTATKTAEIVGGGLLALLGTFFLIRDGDAIWQWALRLLPTAAHHRVDVAGRRGWWTLSGYIRGQVTIAFIHAISITIALLILRVPLAAALGVIVFLGSFIPILGLTIAGALCVGVTLLEHGVTAAIIIAIVIIFLVQAEGNLLQPLIMSRAVHIHPMAVAFAVAAGTTLYSITGALVAVPLVAFTNSFIRALRKEAPDPVSESAPGSDAATGATKAGAPERTGD
jgi:predicted PurR-regulated permease PerM